MVNSLHI